MYILGLNGSPNQNGGTAFLINRILESCANNGGLTITELINVPQAVASAKTPFCTVCGNPCKKVCYSGTLLEEVFEKMAKADALVIGSPVYFGLPSAQLKVFFDKTRVLRSEKRLIGKPCGFVSIGASRFGGQETTIKAMQTMALVQGMTVVGSGHADYDAGHHGVCAVRDVFDDFTLSRCDSMAMRINEELGIRN